MKILRISLLLNLFRNSKNQSKFLTYINIGLFLSIFAISAAVISFVIETKIDKIEFDLAELHQEQRSEQMMLAEIVKVQSQFSLAISNAEALNDLYEYIASTKLGQYTISVNDIYLPALLSEMDDSEWYQEMLDEGMWSAVIELFAESFGEESKEFKSFTKSLEILENYDELFNKDTSLYYQKIFNYDYKEVTDEIFNYESSINLFKTPIYKDYVKMNDIIPHLLNIVSIMQKYYDAQALASAKLTSQLNNEIIDLSRLESQVIIFAFIFQFIVFLIIQYFEVTSIRNEKRLNAKR